MAAEFNKTVSVSSESGRPIYRVVNKAPWHELPSSMYMAICDTDLRNYLNGRGNIQDIMPYLSADEREFIISGIKPDEWDELFEEE